MSGGALTLPWPARELHPNARPHFHVKAKAAKAYREGAYWLAKAAHITAPVEGPIVLRIEFSAPDNRRRDLDGMLSAIKSGLDGFADALETDDSRFELHLRRLPPERPGSVRITICSGEERSIAEIIQPIVEAARRKDAA